ncbi:MAG: ribonuclease III [Anaerohalosphaeraceae bacterium]|nr:ribonuclease III [Anaerohalosphaeraceae bacterium]
MDKEILCNLEKTIKYRFSDKALLEKALTHSSVAQTRLDSNERLEFFGDSILDIIICQALYENFPNYLEGDLTKIKSMLVSRKTCASIASRLGLDELIKVGPGMAQSSALKGSLAAGAIEALIAAIYIDGGIKSASKFVLRVFGELIDQADANEHQENFKSLLQQHSQQEYGSSVNYETLDEKGPDHNKCFETAAVISGKRYKSAWGNNKKEAQQKAAYNALVELGVIEDS